MSDSLWLVWDKKNRAVLSLHETEEQASDAERKHVVQSGDVVDAPSTAVVEVPK